MLSSKINEFDLDPSIFDRIGSNEDLEEIKSSLNIIDTNVDSVKTDVATINTNIDSIKTLLGTNADNTSVFDKLTEIKDSISSNSNNVTGLSNDELVLASVLLRGDTDDCEWVLRQYGIGKVLNSVFNLGSSELASCNTISELIANNAALEAIASNTEAESVCVHNDTLYNALGAFSTDPEVILGTGNGYKRYAVNDTFKLKFNGDIITFRVLAKDYLTTNKIVVVPTIVFDPGMSWGGEMNKNNYSTSGIREYLNSTIYNGFSEKIKNSIVASPVKCHNKSTAVTCNDKIWLLSCTEVGLGSESNAPAAGSAFPYFNSNSKRIMKDSEGNEMEWWLRTPYTFGTDHAWLVDTYGEATTYKITSIGFHILFAFEI